MTIDRRSRVAALALLAVLATGACGGASGGTTASTAASEPGAAGGPPDCLSFADIYALVGPESETVATWDQAATIASELGSSTEFPAGLPIAITAPGERSIPPEMITSAAPTAAMP